ncbi:hypothetical protein TRFO_22998 [Tritrichomonas foetus]|uniref:DUF1349 domain-containing protein n=1 Tax=Tritrichomonas foetus TaxID=1144522 RepID=A0A1J4KB89_9EUKA|nr:hypothetical protein TRFO_22998 [Tritrichomonas foetus]|eukprot:OHT08483.1 hypothetical protein TRFO_22998 [Tritrichomonas foetus]
MWEELFQLYLVTSLLFHVIRNKKMEGWQWLYPPESFEFIGNDGVKIVTKDSTDYWQRTHYGFRNDNGHFLYKKIKGDFVISAETNFDSTTLYDQCGLYARLDEDNWVKTSTEYENEKVSHMGAVVTNLGYSDWSKREIDANIKRVFYQMKRIGNDFEIWVSLDGVEYKEIRVAHFHKEAPELMVGVYACSPKRGGFTCQITNIKITQ